MALAFDASANAGGSTGTVTYTHTCTGSNLVLVVIARLVGADNMTSVTYNGVALTQVTKKQQGGGEAFLYAYLLTNPATGANDVVLTQSGTATMAGLSMSYTGANQSGQPDAFASASGTTLGVNDVSVTVVASNCWLVEGFASNDVSVSYNPDNALERLSFGPTRTADSNATVSTGSQSIGYTSTGSGAYSYAVIGLSIAPLQATPIGFSIVFK